MDPFYFRDVYIFTTETYGLRSYRSNSEWMDHDTPDFGTLRPRSFVFSSVHLSLHLPTVSLPNEKIQKLIMIWTDVISRVLWKGRNRRMDGKRGSGR